MSFIIHELPKAKADKRAILVWLLERSPQGGEAWLKAYDSLLVSLEQNADSFGRALEDKDCHHQEVQQALFKTRRGRVYRVLYFIDGNNVTEGMLNRVEAAIRAHDPCLSCSTHALGQMPIVIEIKNAGGEVVQTLKRD